MLEATAREAAGMVELSRGARMERAARLIGTACAVRLLARWLAWPWVGHLARPLAREALEVLDAGVPRR